MFHGADHCAVFLCLSFAERSAVATTAKALLSEYLEAKPDTSPEMRLAAIAGARSPKTPNQHASRWCFA